jgi:TolB-like protein/DNA-binding winged helix-turn-helix (wHTH) protein
MKINDDVARSRVSKVLECEHNSAMWTEVSVLVHDTSRIQQHIRALNSGGLQGTRIWSGTYSFNKQSVIEYRHAREPPMEAAARTRRTRFGAFEVDLCSGEVYKHGIRLKLQDQPFQVLAFLLEHSGDVVTRDELRQKLWPADTFLDFDNGLNSAIKKLRDVLGDSAEEPRYIETLPRRGYRFIAAVDLPAAGSAQPAAAGAERLLSQPGATDVAPRALSSGRLRNALLTAVAATLVVALVVASNAGGVRTRFLRKPGPARIESIAVLPLVSLSLDSEQEYFAEGVTEALITDLGKISALRVISHTSVMQYKDTKKPLPEIARELKVDVLVEGMVARSGDRVRITANLVQACLPKTLFSRFRPNVTLLH